MTEKISILSLSDGDSSGDISPDLPDLDDWSVDVCREADRRLGNRKFSPWKRPRPLIRRGRSLEQLLKACQVDDDDDFEVRIGISCYTQYHFVAQSSNTKQKNCIVYHLFLYLSISGSDGSKPVSQFAKTFIGHFVPSSLGG